MVVTRRKAMLAMGAAMPLAGCGYHVAGKADLLPQSIQRIAIPPFGNVTTRYRLAERIPVALTREFISRTRYEIVTNADQADAILQGAVINYFAFPTVFDEITNRATSVQIAAILQVKLTERASGKVLFERQAFEARQRYEISTDQVAFFDESAVALDRLSQDVARMLVSAILEQF